MTVLNIYNQKIFVCEESTPGTRVFPITANKGKGASLILAGYINASRSTSYTDSEEIRNSLNLKDQVKDKDAAGTLSMPIYARPGGINNWKAVVNKTTGTWTSSDTELPFDAMTDLVGGTGTINYPGTIMVDSEIIYYTGVTFTSGSTTAGSLTGCVRGYGGTTAVLHDDDTAFEVYDIITEPMGDVLFKSLQGEKMAWTAAIDASGLTAVATSVTFDTLVGHRPANYGVIELDNGSARELIYYTGLTLTEGATSGSFTGCTRDWGGINSGGIIGADGDTIRVASPTYKQKVGRPSFSLWYEQDGIFYCCAGCVMSNLSFTAENAGYPMFEISGNFMTKIWAGKDTITSQTGTSPVVLTLTTSGGAKRFKVGSRVKLYDVSGSTEYNNSGAGYTISAVDLTNNKISIDAASFPLTLQADVDYVQGYLPVDMEIGSTLKSEDTLIKIGGTSQQPTAASVNIDAPTQFIDSIITPDPISEYVGNRRAISCSVTQLLNNERLSLYTDADEDVKQTYYFRLGDDTPGSTMIFYFPKMTVQVPAENVAEPLMELSIESTALDTYSEDNFFIICI